MEQRLIARAAINTHEPILKKLNIEEGYQFNFGESFCNYSYNITISNKNDSVNLHAIVYELKRLSDNNIKLELTNEFDKKLTLANWLEFCNKINYADFWSLKSAKEENGFDGSSLRVDGIIRNHFDFAIIKTHSIQRRFIHNSAIFTAFKTVLQLADLKNECSQ